MGKFGTMVNAPYFVCVQPKMRLTKAEGVCSRGMCNLQSVLFKWGRVCHQWGYLVYFQSTFEVPFNGLFAPTSRSWMSNIFRHSESLGKSNEKKWSQI